MSSKSSPDHPSEKNEPTPLILRAQSALNVSADARRRLTRAGLKSVFLRKESLHLSGNRGDICSYERDRWLFNAYRAGLITKYDLLRTGKLVSDADRDDWDVGRPLPVVARQEGVKSLRDVCLMLESEGMGKSHVLEVGPGDGITSSNLRGEIPGWTVHTYASELYFPFQKTISQFTKPIHNAELHELVQTIFLFLKREFNRSHQGLKGIVPDHANVDLNDVYSLLEILPEWIYHHYDRESGVYSVSKEFPFDTKRCMSDSVRRMLLLIKDPAQLQKFYSTIFLSPFFESLYSDSPLRFDLNESPIMCADGFIPGRFENIRENLMREKLDGSIAFVFGCRSDSHLPDAEYVKFVRDIVQVLLREGGVYLSEGVKRSYSRHFRYQIVSEMLKKEFGNSVKAYAVVDKKTCSPISLYIEKGIKTQVGTTFRSKKVLSKAFDFSAVSLHSLDEVVEQQPLSRVREDVLKDHDGNLEIFSGVQDIMEIAALLVNTGGHSSEIFHNQVEIRDVLEQEGYGNLFEILLATTQDIEAVQYSGRKRHRGRLVKP